MSVRSKWEESDHEEAEVKIKKDKKAKKWLIITQLINNTQILLISLQSNILI